MRKEQYSGRRHREVLQPLLLVVRGRRVILDSDLARLYGVATMRFNEAFKRNRRRFPTDFAFQLSRREYSDLRSQFAMSSSLPFDSTDESDTGAGSPPRGHGGRRSLPWAFTEHGALMAANILRSERAARTSIYVIRAFVRLREEAAADQVLLKRLAEIDTTLLAHDNALRDIYQKLLPLLAPPTDQPKRRIGFHTGTE
jgi:hypothetical protein